MERPEVDLMSSSATYLGFLFLYPFLLCAFFLTIQTWNSNRMLNRSGNRSGLTPQTGLSTVKTNEGATST